MTKDTLMRVWTRVKMKLPVSDEVIDEVFRLALLQLLREDTAEQADSQEED